MARRSQGVPQDPGYVPSRPSDDQLIYRRAENGEMVGYTPAEYGVRKDDGGGLVKPVNSSGGLLFLAILLTACLGGLFYGVVQIAIQGTWHILGEVWWVFPACLYPFTFAWISYFKERRAQKLRKAANLARPVE
ncbi:hypothetical protein B1A87_001915 [Arthrobacter sp. KBS0703]|uniref:hypothetical protein n=1 Tax=Bacteria TaxID=2 RepID=UPI00098FA54E|nr:hypothetical protein [Arthrobacter sp. KBS0703]TSE14858.1 hypothetical protein B1A87_001915 [Arthrobacter sp. KBS0703]